MYDCVFLLTTFGLGGTRGGASHSFLSSLVPGLRGTSARFVTEKMYSLSIEMSYFRCNRCGFKTKYKFSLTRHTLRKNPCKKKPRKLRFGENEWKTATNKKDKRRPQKHTLKGESPSEELNNRMRFMWGAGKLGGPLEMYILTPKQSLIYDRGYINRPNPKAYNLDKRAKTTIKYKKFEEIDLYRCKDYDVPYAVRCNIVEECANVNAHLINLRLLADKYSGNRSDIGHIHRILQAVNKYKHLIRKMELLRCSRKSKVIKLDKASLMN